MFSKFRKNTAFTLAEVLITLGIIGVVAALTIPVLVKNYQKHTTVTKLKKAYTVLYQALESSQAANGYISTWDRSMLSTTNISRQNWFNAYLADYMKVLKTDINYNPTVFYVYLADGEILGFQSADTGSITVRVFLSKDAIINEIPGANEFYFSILLQDKNYLKPYDGGFTTGQNDRDFWTDQATYGCNKTSTYKSFCAGLIMYDGWQIKDDYPYFND